MKNYCYICLLTACMAPMSLQAQKAIPYSGEVCVAPLPTVPTTLPSISSDSYARRFADSEMLRFPKAYQLDHGKRLCAVFGGDEERGFRYVIGSRILDMRPLAKELNETFHGRGGGKSEMVQGSVQGNESEMRAWIQEKARKMNG